MPTLPLIISIRDYRYRANITVPSGTPPVTIIEPLQPQPKVEHNVRIVKILPEEEKRLPDANSGETINITATVVCKTGESISKPRDNAYLIIDGAVADRKTVENGIVTFEWEATAAPINIHTICVKVEPSTNCNSPGQDCKRITVSPNKLSIEEQIARERESASEQKKLLEQARTRLRSEIIESELQVPGKPTPIISTPTISEPIIISEPLTAVHTISTPEKPPEYGNIEIIGLPALLLPITPDIPLYVYIDNKNVGRLYELPKTITNVSVGTHSIYSRGGDITSPTKTAVIKSNETTTVTL